MSDGIYHVVFSGIESTLGQRFQMGFHYDLKGSSESTDYYDCCLEIMNLFPNDESPLGALGPCLAENVKIDGIRVAKVRPNGGVPAIGIRNLQGTADGEADTITTGMQVQWLGTAPPGEPEVKIMQGWTTIPGIPADVLTAGTWDGDYLTACGTWADAMLATLEPGGDVGGELDMIIATKSAATPQIVSRNSLKRIPGKISSRLDRRF